jgi:signal transduction histidine kinase
VASRPSDDVPELGDDNVSADLTAADTRWAQRVLTALSAGVLVFDQREHVLYANRPTAELLGRAESAIVGRPLRDVLGPVAATASMRDTPPPIEFDLDVGPNRARRVHCSITEGGSVEPGRLRYRICMLQDVTHVHELRDERDRLLQLGTLHTILPSVLHELRNPLAAIESMVEVMVEDAQGQQREDLYAILTVVRQMGLNLQGVGSVSRDMRSSTYEAIDRVVLDVVRVMTARAQEMGVRLVADVIAMPLLRFDPSVIRAVVFNLVDNAVKACVAERARHPVVTVRLRYEQGGGFVLDVIDDGCGMEPHVLARCREPFFSTKPRGSGIGLALCDRTVERAGGTMTIKSVPGEGTHVHVRLAGQPKSDAGAP